MKRGGTFRDFAAGCGRSSRLKVRTFNSSKFRDSLLVFSLGLGIIKLMYIQQFGQNAVYVFGS